LKETSLQWEEANRMPTSDFPQSASTVLSMGADFRAVRKTVAVNPIIML